jgi:hypothetical protein
VSLLSPLVIALLVAGCALAPSSAPVTPRPTAPPTSPPAAATACIAASAQASGVVVDASLLAVLPPTVDGFAIKESSETEAPAAQAPELSTVATRFAAGFVADQGGANWAYAVVVVVRPCLMNDAAFRDWRDSYDQGACSQAGGVGGHAEAPLGGRTVTITTCGGGLHTYHVWLADRQQLVSVASVGEQRFGEKIVSGIP